MADEALRIAKAHDQVGLIIAGEVDESGYVLLMQSLAALDRQDDVHLDLGGIEFCDLAGLRAIVRAGRIDEDATPDRRVCLHAVPLQLQKVMQILGWDEMPGVAFDEQPLDSYPDTGHPAPDAKQPACD